jgi:hypothetical protein
MVLFAQAARAKLAHTIAWRAATFFDFTESVQSIQLFIPGEERLLMEIA